MKRPDIGRLLLGDIKNEEIHNDTFKSISLFIAAGFSAGLALTEGFFFYISTVVAIILALRLHPGAERIALDWLEKEDLEGGSE